MYQIIDVPSGAAEFSEQLGTKYKFWYRDQSYGLTLFKEGRPGTGENWAEKIACELAQLLQLPHAQYEFARYRDKDGVVSPTLVAGGARLIHGNELLATFTTDYGASGGKLYQRKDHTIRRVLSYFRGSSDFVGGPYGWHQSEELSSALDFFIGYLMFDAWIANQDRHDENWGILRTIDGNSFLAPSYDHGSSMARNETDEKRAIMLTTNDMGRHISKYAASARSSLFPQAAPGTSTKALFTLEAFEIAARQSQKAAAIWRERLASVQPIQIESMLANVPSVLMSDVAKRFTTELLELNRTRILNVRF